MRGNAEESREDLAKRWLAAVIQGLERYADKDQQVEILELCGQSCAKYDLQDLKKLKREARDQEELLALINEHIPWCGDWVWEKDHVYSTCESCGCPLIRDYHLELSPVFCLCSRGWVQTMFSEAFGEEVEVKLSKAIGRGDECCEFFVYLEKDGE